MSIEFPGASSSGLPELGDFSESAPSTWIDGFQSHFNEWVFGPIRRLVPSQDALVGFIMMACAIDYLAGFWWGKTTDKSVKSAYTGFIRRYFPPGQYDPEGLYDSLRNGLVHMFTIKNKTYALTHDRPDLHLRTDKKGQLVLNASDLMADLEAASDAYFAEARISVELSRKANDRYQRDGFLGKSPLQME